MKKKEKESSNYAILLQLICAENAKQQIEQLKKVMGDISNQLKSQNTVEDDLPLIGQFLVHLFFISTTKNPLRRVIISSFQGFPASVQTSVLTPHIENYLRQMFLSVDPEEHEKERLSTDECLNLRHNVDTIAALIENFSLGEDCVIRVCLPTLSYLGLLLQIFYRAYGPHLSPVQQNEVMHHCLETVKLANRVIQRSSVAMETYLKDTVALTNFIATVTEFISTDIQILQKDSFLLDCKTTSSMNICLILKHTSIGPHILAFIAQTAFQHINWFFKEQDSIQLPDWLTGFRAEQLKQSSLSASSYLCLCYGILTMLDMNEQLKSIDGRCVLLDVLLPEFLILTKRCTEVGSKLLASKSICVLSQKIRTYLQKGGYSSCDPVILQRFNGENQDMKTVLDYVWTSWEDSVDAIRFTVKDLFENVVSIHALVSRTGPREDAFLGNLADSILSDVNWSCKGKYGTLAVLVGHIGSTRMLAMHDGIAGEILDQLKEQTLACYASDLYETLFLSHKTQLSHSNVHRNPSDVLGNSMVVNSNSNTTAWHTSWTDPVISVLCGSHKLQKKHTIEYILPKLLKTGQDTLQYMIRTLSTQIDQKTTHRYDRQLLTQTENQLGALVMCLRRARVMGQLKTNSQGQASKVEVYKEKGMGGTDQGQSESSKVKVIDLEMEGHGQLPDIWCGVVSVNLLQKALICKDEQIRLDSLALLCENQKTSETLTDTELKLVQGFIPENLNSHNPAFRQVLLSHLKKFLSRMKESTIALKRQLAKDKKVHGVLMAYKGFLTHLTRHLLVSLYPGCVFAKRTTCLGGLSTIMNQFSRKSSSEIDTDFSFHDVVRPCDITSLLDCLTDTYEDNKREAADILISCSQAYNNTGVMDESMTKEMAEIGFQLSQSTRPQDCMTAAYLFKVLLHQPHIYGVFQKIAGGEITIKDSGDITLCDSRESNTEKDGYNTAFECGHATEFENNELGRKCLLLHLLLGSLEAQVGVAKTNLIVAAANKPMYPTMLCMRYCLMEVNYKKIPAETRTVWQGFFERFISLCLEISEIVSPVVQNSSPEGNVPLDKIPGGAMMFDSGNESLARSRDTVMLMPEYLIVCCWRSTKEISLLFGQLTTDLPIDSSLQPHSRTIQSESMKDIQETITDQSKTIINDIQTSQSELHKSNLEDEMSVLPSVKLTEKEKLKQNTSTEKPQPICDVGFLLVSQVLEIGAYFTTQLLESVHRGAFELAYAGFVKLTDMLWRSSIPKLHHLPKQWLGEVMEDIKSGSSESRLCATRRSAGVPFYVQTLRNGQDVLLSIISLQALVSTEPSSTGRVCFRDTMQQLLILAYDETIATTDSCSAKVHALNILRALYKDSRLKDDVSPYIADGLKVAILGFKSDLWAVRNSATLLMTAMMTRIFGVKRSRDETSFSRKNCQTGKTFFFKYPALYQFLLDQLTEVTSDLATQLHPGLYPILMVLGRLFPSTMEGTDTSLNLAAFIPLVIKCSCSPVLKTRVIAARALQPLVEKDHVIKVFSNLLSLLPCQQSTVLRQNQIHGVLLQMREMLMIVPELPESIRSTLGQQICDDWVHKQQRLISRENPCLLTRKEALEISVRLLTLFGPKENLKKGLESVLLQEISQESELTSLYGYSPGLSEFRMTICDIFFNYFSNTTLCDRLTDVEPDSEEFRKVEGIVLTFLRSDSYEVRRHALEIILDNFVLPKEKQENYHQENKGNEEDSLRSNSSYSMRVDKGVHSILNKSAIVHTELLLMVEKETHEDCQVNLFRVLAVHPMTELPETWNQQEEKGNQSTRIQSNESVQTGNQLCEKENQANVEETLGRLCCRLKNESLSDSVVAAILEFTGSLLLTVCKHGGTGNQTSIQGSPAVSQLLEIVEGYSCSDCSADIQLACAHLIQKSCRHIGSHRNQEAMLRVTLNLLQADDLEVREAAADVHCILSQNNLHVRAHPYVSLRLLLETWLTNQETSEEGYQCLVDLISGSEQKNEVLEERLFDRGEMNAYRDEMDFIQTLDMVLEKYLRKKDLYENQSMVMTTTSSIGDSPHQFTKSLFEGNETDVKNILEKADRLISQSSTNSSHLSLSSMFHSTADYQGNILCLYRHIVMLKYCISFSNDVELTEKCSELCQKIRQSVKSRELPGLIVDYMECVANTQKLLISNS